ncbi:MAG: hypothetical protein M1822_003302 [Bathelium mastoideum]|nr:MAG: hypothetical protein M1822_003302 [Bathelium mastoideum]
MSSRRNLDQSGIDLGANYGALELAQTAIGGNQNQPNASASVNIFLSGNDVGLPAERGAIPQQSLSSHSSGSTSRQRVSGLPSIQSTQHQFSLQAQLEKLQHQLEEKNQVIARLLEENQKRNSENEASTKQQQVENDKLDAALQESRKSTRLESARRMEVEKKLAEKQSESFSQLRECEMERDHFRKEFFELQCGYQNLQQQLLERQGRSDTLSSLRNRRPEQFQKRQEKQRHSELQADLVKKQADLANIDTDIEERDKEKAKMRRELDECRDELDSIEKREKKSRQGRSGDSEARKERLNRRITFNMGELKEFDEREGGKDMERRSKLLRGEINNLESRIADFQLGFSKPNSKDQDDGDESEEDQIGADDGHEDSTCSESVPDSTTGPSGSMTTSLEDTTPIRHSNLPKSAAPEIKVRTTNPNDSSSAVQPPTRPRHSSQIQGTQPSQHSTGTKKDSHRHASQTSSAARNQSEQSHSQRNSRSTHHKRYVKRSSQEE